LLFLKNSICGTENEISSGTLRQKLLFLKNSICGTENEISSGTLRQKLKFLFSIFLFFLVVFIYN